MPHNTRHLLVVEDDENDVFFLRRCFQGAPVTVQLHIVHDGRQALDYLHGRGEFANRSAHPLPALVLLDLKVPYVSGLEVLRQIREHECLRQLVVVMHTSSALDSDVSQAYALGANSFLVKPARLEDLREQVALLMRYWLQNNLAPVSGRVAIHRDGGL